MRVHNIAQGIINTGNFIDSCFRWVNPMRSLIAFIVCICLFRANCQLTPIIFIHFFKSFIIITLNFEIYMLPLTFLMIFIKNYIIIKLKSVNSNDDVI